VTAFSRAKLRALLAKAPPFGFATEADETTFAELCTMLFQNGGLLEMLALLDECEEHLLGCGEYGYDEDEDLLQRFKAAK